MEYLVIELKDKPHIITKSNMNMVDIREANDPYIFKDKNTAYRVASTCKQGLVYPIFDVMKTLEVIKLKMKSGDYFSGLTAVEELLNMLNEVV